MAVCSIQRKRTSFHLTRGSCRNPRIHMPSRRYLLHCSSHPVLYIMNERVICICLLYPYTYAVCIKHIVIHRRETQENKRKESIRHSIYSIYMKENIHMNTEHICTLHCRRSHICPPVILCLLFTLFTFLRFGMSQHIPPRNKPG